MFLNIFIYASTLLILVSKIDALNITTPDDIFTKKDQEIEFSCATTDGAKIEFCTFTSPNGTNPMEYHDMGEERKTKMGELFVNDSVQLPHVIAAHCFNDILFKCVMGFLFCSFPEPH